MESQPDRELCRRNETFDKAAKSNVQKSKFHQIVQPIEVIDLSDDGHSQDSVESIEMMELVESTFDLQPNGTRQQASENRSPEIQLKPLSVRICSRLHDLLKNMSDGHEMDYAEQENGQEGTQRKSPIEVQCPMCSFKTRTNFGLNMHLRKDHSSTKRQTFQVDNNVKGSGQEQKKFEGSGINFPCSMCSFTSRTNFGLRRHWKATHQL